MYIGVMNKGVMYFMRNQEKKNKQQKKSMLKSTPAWAWIFMILCILIPIVSMGGAIPGALGVGGAAGCANLAKSKKMKKSMRIISCIELTILCWELWYLMIIIIFAGLG